MKMEEAPQESLSEDAATQTWKPTMNKLTEITRYTLWFLLFHFEQTINSMLLSVE